MKKHTILFMILTVIGCQQQTNEAQSKRNPLVLKEKRIFEQKFEFGEPVEESKLTTTIKFDKNGNKTEKSFYSQAKYLYDEDVQELIELKTDSQILTQKYLYQYDEKDSLVKDYTQYFHSLYRLSSGSDNDLRHMAYKKSEDTLRREISKYYYKDNGNIKERVFPDGAFWQYTFENKKSMIVTLFKPDSSIEYKAINVYNKLDQIIEVKVYGKNGNLSTKTLLEYDENGNLKYEYRDLISDSESHLDSKTEYKYDEQGRLIEEINWWLDNEKIGSRQVYNYNNGLLIERTKYDESNEPIKSIKYEYEYFD